MAAHAADIVVRFVALSATESAAMNLKLVMYPLVSRCIQLVCVLTGHECAGVGPKISVNMAPIGRQGACYSISEPRLTSMFADSSSHWNLEMPRNTGR